MHCILSRSHFEIKWQWHRCLSLLQRRLAPVHQDQQKPKVILESLVWGAFNLALFPSPKPTRLISQSWKIRYHQNTACGTFQECTVMGTGPPKNVLSHVLACCLHNKAFGVKILGGWKANMKHHEWTQVKTAYISPSTVNESLVKNHARDAFYQLNLCTLL